MRFAVRGLRYAASGTGGQVDWETWRLGDGVTWGLGEEGDCEILLIRISAA